MHDKGYTKAKAVAPDTLKDEPLLNLSSGYITRAEKDLPKQAESKPWKLNQNFILDNLALRFTSVDDEEMNFS